MGQTPSARRRLGRIAFDEGACLDDNPWLNEKSTVWNAESYAIDWADGWNEACDQMVAEENEPPSVEEVVRELVDSFNLLAERLGADDLQIEVKW